MRVENSPAHTVYANQGSQFIDIKGDPIPSSELQQVVQDAGRSRGLEMKVEWLSSAWGQSCFVVKQKWPQGDKKWERVQCGELAPENAFDVVFRWPPEMRQGDMVAQVRDKFGLVRDPKAEADRLIKEAERLYAEAANKKVDTVVDIGTQRILDESDHQRRLRANEMGITTHERAHPMISGTDFADREPKRLLGS